MHISDRALLNLSYYGLSIRKSVIYKIVGVFIDISCSFSISSNKEDECHPADVTIYAGVIAL